MDTVCVELKFADGSMVSISTLCRYLASDVVCTICCPSASNWAGSVLYFLAGMVNSPFVLLKSIAFPLKFASAIVYSVYYKFEHKAISFLAEAEIRKDPGKTAWILLAKEFCEKLAEHIDEFMDEDESTAREAMEIYMACEDGGEGLYDLLPAEARLFDPIE